MISKGFSTYRVRSPLLARTGRRIRSTLAWLPLTPQSTALLLLALYLIFGPVHASSDIVSASLAFGLLAVVTLVALFVLAQGVQLRSKPLLSVTPPGPGSHANEKVRIILTLAPVRLLPGTYLECSLDFAHPGITPHSLRISGASKLERKLPLDLSFPHRGSWEIRGLLCSLRDSAGLAQISWNIPLQNAILIDPPLVAETHLPLLSSTQRPGDLVTDTLNRFGDPFDIKPYHPTDGVKKIVWKAFAKSGELLSRHPEASMTPEGFVTIVVLARPEDDTLCGKATAYVRALKELKLDLLVGCEGSKNRELATDVSSCQELLVDSVWDAALSTPASLIEDTQAVLDYCSQSSLQISVRKMILFVAGSRVADPLQARSIEALAQWLTSRHIEPIFCLSEPENLSTENSLNLPQRVRTLFIANPTAAETRAVSAHSYRAFLSSCLSKQWEVFI
jgi:hypothetical protein